MDERLPPFDMVAEEAVLGSVLVDPESLIKVADWLKVQDFYREKNAWVYEAFLALKRKGEAVNQITVAHELAENRRLEEVGGSSYLAYVVSVLPTSIYVEHFAHLVHELALRRKLIEAGRKIANLGMMNQDAHSSVAQAIEVLRGLDGEPLRSLRFGPLVIVKTNPPHYHLVVNGVRLNLDMRELISWEVFKRKIIAIFDFIPQKPTNWEALVNNMLAIANQLPAATDASEEAQIKLSIGRLFERKTEAEAVEDLRTGYYLHRDHKEEEFIFFQSTPVIKWLGEDIKKRIAADNLWALLLQWGVVRRSLKLGDKRASVWGLPANFLEEERQTGLPEWF